MYIGKINYLANTKTSLNPAALAILIRVSIDGGFGRHPHSKVDRVLCAMPARLANATCVSDVVARAERTKSAASFIALTRNSGCEVTMVHFKKDN